MLDRNKTKDQLIDELQELRKKLKKYEQLETTRIHGELDFKEGEKCYRALAELNSVGIWHVTFHDHKTLYINKAMKDFLGIEYNTPFEDINLYNFTTKESLQRINQEDRQKRVEGLTSTYEIDMKRTDGEIRRFLLSEGAIFSENRQVISTIGALIDITEHKMAAQTLKQSEETYRNVFHNAQVGLFRTRIQDGHFLECNEQIVRMFGYEDRNKFLAEIYLKDHYVDNRVREKMLKLLMLEGKITDYEAEIVLPSGRKIWIRLSAKLYPEKGWIEGIAIDVTERKKAQKKLYEYTLELEKTADDLQKNNEELQKAYEKLQLAANVFENTTEAIMVTDAKGSIISVNPAFTKITGYCEEEVFGKNPRILKSGRHNSNFYEEMWKQLFSKGRWRGEIWNRRRNGEIYPQWQNVSIIKDDQGEISHFVSVFSDVSKMKQSEQRLNYLAYHDSLTGAANRLLFYDRLQQAIWQAGRKQEKVVILFLDLDRFKSINDSLGHYVGDMVLRKVANRLQKSLRETDTISRWGGDEFTIIFPGIKQAEDSKRVAKKILSVISKNLIIENKKLQITASIGVALFPDDGLDIDVLLRNADNAMYQAKLKGKNNYQFCSENGTDVHSEKNNLEDSFKKALANNEFLLCFQPQIDIDTGILIGMEALLYWQPFNSKMISPNDFIPIAEQTGFINTLGEWVIHTACKQNKLWQDKGFNPLTMAVNLSQHQIQHKDFIQSVDHVLDETKMDPQYLEMEITENALMGNIETSKKNLAALKERGISIALDDFGTGYSSLSDLQQFPIDKLKIDRSFIQTISNTRSDHCIATTVIAIGRNLKMAVIAEGVETKGQLDFLRHQQCHEAQGFYFSRPVIAEKATELLVKEKWA